MASWGHVVFKAEPRVEYQRFCRMHHVHTGFCGKDAGYVKRYTYTTGRGGKYSTADTWICESHAQAFAARYKIQILDADPHIGCICLMCVTARARKRRGYK